MKDNGINAGPRAQNGFALQRNTALYVLLDNYDSKFKNEKYFLCLEHHDDFLFCFLNNEGQAKSIEAFQSKKKSSDKWTVNKDFAEILTKLLNTGSNLQDDLFPKAGNYNHILFFSSNASIVIEKKIKGEKISVSINEENCRVSFDELEEELQQNIKDKIGEKLTSKLKCELNNLQFLYIVFARTNKEQQNQLHGKLDEVFSDKITDHRAALKALTLLFHDIETSYNQGNKTKLLDETKRVSSEEINSALKIITTKSKALEYWRKQYKEIRKVLYIKPGEQEEEFKLTFETAFEFFKDLKNAEHNKILKFVKDNYRNCKTFQEEENVSELYENLWKTQTTNLEGIKLKAIIYAAYFEAINKKSN